jgi:ArsR family transcriptional regulator
MNENDAYCASLMKALSDETRLRIVKMISGGELCACEILEQFHITQPTLSYHMKLLCESGLVESRKDGIWMKYTLKLDVLNLLTKLFESIGADAEKTSERKEACNCTEC